MKEKGVHGGWGFYFGSSSSAMLVYVPVFGCFQFSKKLWIVFNEFWVVRDRAYTFNWKKSYVEFFRGVNMDFYTFLLNLILSFSICNKFKINVFIKIQTFYVDIIIVKNNLFLHKHVTINFILILQQNIWILLVIIILHRLLLLEIKIIIFIVIFIHYTKCIHTV